MPKHILSTVGSTGTAMLVLQGCPREFKMTLFRVRTSQSKLHPLPTTLAKKVLHDRSLFNTWAGRRGLMDSTLGSGDRVRGFKSRSRRSGFFWAFFFFLLLLLPHHVTSLSHNACWPVNSGLQLCTGEAKRELTWKNPSSAICGGETQK